MRVEPPTSEVTASGAAQWATAAAQPPLDPPGERVTSCGVARAAVHDVGRLVEHARLRDVRGGQEGVAM